MWAKDDLPDDTIVYPEFAKHIVGVIERCAMPPTICYSRDGVLAQLAEELGSYEAAVEWFEYNVIGGYVGESTPVFLSPLEPQQEIVCVSD
jgi:hypothetical protein